MCLGSKLDRADVMRGRLGVIRAAEPPGFRYCCARGIPNRPAGPAKKLQRFETLRLLWRCDSVCSGVSAILRSQCCRVCNCSSYWWFLGGGNTRRLAQVRIEESLEASCQRLTRLRSCSSCPASVSRQRAVSHQHVAIGAPAIPVLPFNAEGEGGPSAERHASCVTTARTNVVAVQSALCGLVCFRPSREGAIHATAESQRKD